MNKSREVACESDEGIEFHTLVLEVLPRINELDPADHAVSVPKSETEQLSERFSSVSFSVLSPQRQPVQGPVDGADFFRGGLVTWSQRVPRATRGEGESGAGAPAVRPQHAEVRVEESLFSGATRAARRDAL